MKDGYRHSQKKGVPSGSRLCSDHFKDSDYITPPGAPRKMLKSGSVPTVFNTESFKNRKRKRLACDYGVVSEESSIVSNRIMDAADEIKPTQSSNGAEHGYCKPARFCVTVTIRTIEPGFQVVECFSGQLLQIYGKNLLEQ
ncbi:uncharacterized protein [Watersipora subatra]|uniref:uncharacterized protein n=1 Tax=Watersipora subatra TaxID=2589382 RepID=UPI00355BE4DE